jgi:hypothetical protein
MSDPTDPRSVLETLRRLEAEVQELRARTRRAPDVPDPDELRRAMAADAARERRQVVEDLEVMADLVAASWRSSRAQVEEVLGEVRELRAEVGRLRASVEGAHLEVRFGRVNGSGAGHAAAGPLEARPAG